MNGFEPSLRSAHERLAHFRVDAYARTRNHIDGSVSRLSPYLTHGLLSLSEVFHAIDARHPLGADHKFVFELGWRSYFRHVWRFLGEALHDSIHRGPLADEEYSQELPDDVIAAQTGIPAIDVAVRELYATGYLHNHARMWLASYLVHVRRVHWHCGAQWLLAYLLDGDLASNHLSWQWVAGTGSVKPYLFNADNVEKFAPSSWHSRNTVIDISYEAMREIAYGLSRPPKAPLTDTAVAIAVPVTRSVPANLGWANPDRALVRGRTIWLMHPWSLGGLPGGVPDDALCIAVGFAECHARTPWSLGRWEFVTRAMKSRAAHVWWGEVAAIAEALEDAEAIHWQAEPHADPALLRLRDILSASLGRERVTTHAPFDLFEPVEEYCASFSQWWRRTRLKR